MSDVLEFVTPVKRPLGGWSRAEYAQIQRLLGVLGNDPRPISLTSGVTDEGEPWTVGVDTGLCGRTFYCQLIQADPGASRGVAFSRGLELILGSR